MYESIRFLKAFEHLFIRVTNAVKGPDTGLLQKVSGQRLVNAFDGDGLITRAAGHEGDLRTVARWLPRPAMPSSTRSPSCRKTGGCWCMPSPGGVPVAMRSPGTSFI